MVTDEEETLVKVDENAKMVNCTVVKATDDLYYDVLMTKVDIKKHFYGVSNFYVM